jgi:hypothetical protein
MSSQLLSAATTRTTLEPTDYLFAYRPAALLAQRLIKVSGSDAARDITRLTTAIDAATLRLGEVLDGSEAPDTYTVLELVGPSGSGAVGIHHYLVGSTPTRQVVVSPNYTGNPFTTLWLTLDGSRSAQRFSPNKDYQQDEQVVDTIDGEDRFFLARMALLRTSFGGTVPAPTGAKTDTNWREASPASTLLLSQPLNHATLQDLYDDALLKPGQQYRVINRFDKTVDPPVQLPDVLVVAGTVQAFKPEAFEVSFTDDALTPVSYDLTTDTTTPRTGGGGGGPTVVQSTGTSTTEVMSQKAVTDELLTPDQKSRVNLLTRAVGLVDAAGVAWGSDILEVPIDGGGYPDQDTVFIFNKPLTMTADFQNDGASINGNSNTIQPGGFLFSLILTPNVSLSKLTFGGSGLRFYGGTGRVNELVLGPNVGMDVLEAADVTLLDSVLRGTITVAGILRLGPGTNDDDATYTITGTGQVIDERGGSSGPTLYQATIADITTKFNDVVLLAPATFTLVGLINTPSWTAQLLNTTTGAAYGPQRTTEADINADIAAAFALGPASVEFKIAPASVTDATRLAFILFTLS